MKSILTLFLALVALGLQPLHAGDTAVEKTETSALLAKVDGMTCGACVNHVSEALLAKTDLQEIFIDLPSGRVLGREKAEHRVDATLVRDVVESLGFSVISVEHLPKSFEAAKAELEAENS